MSIKFRLTAMQFLQFFVWGAWLISLGGYMGGTLHFEGGQIGAIFATMGIASLIMPGLTGIIADKWINAERLYGILHLIGAGALIYASTATTYNHMYWAMLLNMLVYMPTLSLANTVSYNALEKYKMDLIKDFPPIRVWGTVGFICAMWAVDLTGFKASSAQLYVAAISAPIACGPSHIASHAGTLCFHFASLPPHAQRRKNDALRFRTGRTGAVQAQEDGYLLLVLHAAGSRPSNNKHIRRPFPGFVCFHTRICRFVRCKTLRHPALHLANE